MLVGQGKGDMLVGNPTKDEENITRGKIKVGVFQILTDWMKDWQKLAVALSQHGMMPSQVLSYLDF